MYASTGHALYPFVSPEGGKEALQADFSDYTMGSDHDVYQEGSFRIPAIYMNDWPDRYIHTNGDVAANIDPTKLKRAAFIGAASGYFLAKMGAGDVPELLSIVERSSLMRITKLLRRRKFLQAVEADSTTAESLRYERETEASIHDFAPLSEELASKVAHFADMRTQIGAIWWPDYGNPLISHSVPGFAMVVYARADSPKGPMSVFGYDYLTDHVDTKNVPRPKLLGYQGFWGSGEEYAYETLNFVDGKRTAEQIREMVEAEYGPVPFELIPEYLKALESIGVLKRVQ
jgi:hypothetical protein